MSQWRRTSSFKAELEYCGKHIRRNAEQGHHRGLIALLQQAMYLEVAMQVREAHEREHVADCQAQARRPAILRVPVVGGY